MFGEKTRRIQQLEEQLFEAHLENAELKNSPYVIMGEAIYARVRQRIESIDPEAAIEEAVANEEERLFQVHLGALVAKETTERIDVKKAEITERAEIIADEQAAQALRQFLDEEAGSYFLAEIARLSSEKLPGLVAQEKRRLREEALAQIDEMAKDRAADEFEQDDKRSDPEYNKKRAKTIRNRTERSRLLMLGKLKTDDVLKLDFVGQGDGNKPFTSDYGYSSNDDLVIRTMRIRLVNPEDGEGVVEHDSWYGERQEGAYPQTPIRVFCLDPIHREDELAAINKAASLTITDIKGNLLSDPVHEVWRADLNGYRVLS